jgi:hypothetical protein
MADEFKLPSRDEIEELPRWAMVAFAARCARRVQPLFEARWPDAPSERVRAVDRAIGMSEQAGAMAAASAGNARAFADAARAARADATTEGAATVAQAATYAARAAEAADPAYTTGTVLAAARAAAVYGWATSAAIRRDFEHLRAAASAESWTDRTPVPPAFFGPLWPDGEPPNWPVEDGLAARHDDPFGANLGAKIPVDVEPEPDHRAILQVVLPEHYDSDVVAHYLASLVEAMSRWQFASGGNTIEIDDLLPMVAIEQGVPHA